MSSTVIQLLLSLLSGGVGGNLAAAVLKRFSLGPIGNTIVGLIGGGLVEQLMNSTGMLQSAGTAGNVAGSVVGGGVLMAIIGVIKNMIAKPEPSR